MGKYRSNIILVLLTASIIRLWNLGAVPAGISLTEAHFGLFVAKYLGTWVLNPFFVRVPFVFLGIWSIYLSYKLLKRVTKNEKLSFLFISLLTFLPWHIEQSRIVGLGMVLFVLFLFASLKIIDTSSSLAKKKLLALFVILGFILGLSLFRTNQGVADKVNTQRNIVAQGNVPGSRIFINKVVENYRQDEKLIFENLDWGNYFFKGHPRERWGTEEVQKFFVILIPFFVIGLFYLEKKTKTLIYFWTLLSLIVIFLFRADGPQFTFPLIFPISLITSLGIQNALVKKGKIKKILLCLAVLIFVFEFFTFAREYFWNLGESLFSPRRPIYEKIVKSIEENKKDGERVMVSTRLGDPEEFLKFYLGSNYSAKYTYSNFNVFNLEDKDFLFVDVLPYEPSPAEPLYGKDGKLPEQIHVLSDFNDDMLKEQVFVYRYQ